MSDDRKKANGAVQDEARADGLLLLATVCGCFANLLPIIAGWDSHILAVLGFSCIGWLVFCPGVVIWSVFIRRCSWLAVVIASIIAAAGILINAYFLMDITWRME